MSNSPDRRSNEGGNVSQRQFYYPADAKPLPPELQGVIDLKEWARSVTTGARYTEPDPDAMTRMMLVQILQADSLAEVFANEGILGLQERLPQTPGATTGNIQIQGLYVAESDQADGLPTYMVMEILSLESGEVYRTTTGAGNLQMQTIKLLTMGVWPIKCKIVRLDRVDKGGKYILRMFPPD